MKLWLKTGLIGAIIPIIFAIIITIYIAISGTEIHFSLIVGLGGASTTFYNNPLGFMFLSFITIFLPSVIFSIPGFIIGAVIGLVYEKFLLKPLFSKQSISNRNIIIKKEQTWWDRQSNLKKSFFIGLIPGSIGGIIDYLGSNHTNNLFDNAFYLFYEIAIRTVFFWILGIIILKIYYSLKSQEKDDLGIFMWLRYGIVLALLWIGLFLLYAAGYFWKQKGDYFHDAVPVFFIFLCIFFIVGALIGFIVGKIKSKK